MNAGAAAHLIPRDGRPPRFVVIGIPGSRRVELFDAALQRQGIAASLLVPWLQWIEGSHALAGTLRAGDIVRIESPGQDFAVERAILREGIESAEDDRCAMLGAAELARLDFDRGRILCPRQWYLGFARLLGRLKNELSEINDLVLMNDCDDIALMFDKPSCHLAMLEAGISVPASLGQPNCYDELVAEMVRRKIHRVFVKLAHGSSGSGVVAYQTDGRRHLAWTTVETARSADGIGLYNTRKLRRLSGHLEIARLIDELCRHRVHVETWIPKAGIEGMVFDLRVVMIAAAPRRWLLDSAIRRSPICIC